jgi:hypothetical protein
MAKTTTANARVIGKYFCPKCKQFLGLIRADGSVPAPPSEEDCDCKDCPAREELVTLAALKDDLDYDDYNQLLAKMRTQLEPKDDLFG